MADSKWIKPRHMVVRTLLGPWFRLACVMKYHVKIERFKEQEKRPYLILYNHQTAFDQFFVALSMKGFVYFLATEDIFSNGLISKMLRYAVEPVPIRKQTLDLSAIRTCMRVVKEGGTLAIAPEGNRTYSGKTEYINPSIASLAKKMGLPILLYRIEGGYGVQPRWSDVVRRGKMRAYVAEVIQPEEYAEMTKEELSARIEQGLYVNEANSENVFRHTKKAEYLERAMYVCPDCGLTTFESHGDVIRCTKCDRRVRYTDTTALVGEGEAFPFPYVSQWYDYQKDFINHLDVTTLTAEPLYEEQADLIQVFLYKNKRRIRKNATIRLYGDRMEVEDFATFRFDEVGAVTMLGRNKLNVYAGDHVYQFKGSKRFNALKYVHFYNRYINVSRGNAYAEFLGL